MSQEGKVFIGLDIGTTSVGWAAVNEKNRVIRKGGKSLWGIRLFDEGQPQKNRRVFRSTRRRLQRRRERIVLLQSLFAAEMNKTDPHFFRYLDYSYLKKEDYGQLDFKMLLHTINPYHRKSQFPTIYHLQQHLVRSKEKVDIRLLYLAIHHLIKYRGHFTLENQDFGNNGGNALASIVQQFNAFFEQEEDENLQFSLIDDADKAREMVEKYKNTKGLTKRAEVINSYLNPNDNPRLKKLVEFFVGKKKKLVDLLPPDTKIDEEFLKKSISPKDADWDEVMDKIQGDLGDNIELLTNGKEFYDALLMKVLLKDHVFLCDMMVERYNKHKTDLQKLKKWVKSNAREHYSAIFRADNETDNNYVRYVGSTISQNKKRSGRHCAARDFYSFLEKKLSLKERASDPYIASILEDMENDNFLPKLNSTVNGVFPYQLNEKMLRQILRNQARNYPFLLESDKYRTTGEKIIQILTFRVPYYVGPLNKSSKFAWLERSDEKIYPWNFSEVVDVDKSAINFIERMKNKCQYLYSEPTLPKSSMIYQKFCLLNELNKININGEPITPECKQDLLTHLFAYDPRVTVEKIAKFLRMRGAVEVCLTTSNGKPMEPIKSQLSTEAKFHRIFGSQYEKYAKDFENIIVDLTVFEDKKMLVQRLEQYSLPSNIIELLSKERFKDWGNLSKKLLCELKIPDENNVDCNGEVKFKSLLEIMEETNQNLQEIINKTEFQRLIEQENGADKEGVFSYSLVSDLPTSPANKRALWQVLLIVKEVEKILKRRINGFFIEFARGPSEDQKKKRTVSRKDTLQRQYKEAGKLIEKSLAESLAKKEEGELKNKKLFLYFQQLGKDIYTGNPIDLNDLNTGAYDIDHILPRAMIKDDSIDNLVLVNSDSNRKKSDHYPLPYDLVSPSARKHWEALKSAKLMSEEKYARLTRTKPLSDSELSGFINRQLVFTRQSTKLAANILKNLYPESEVHYSKALNVSEFRNKFHIWKSRDVNDLHHAHDAYLNVVVGRVYVTRFQTNLQYYNYDFKKCRDSQEGYNLDKLFKFKTTNLRTGEVIWEPNSSIVQVKKQLAITDILYTQQPSYTTGAFYKQTVYSNGDKLVPLKGKGPRSDVKYGGYGTVQFSHFVLIKRTNRKTQSISFSIESLPILFKKCKEDRDLVKYFQPMYPKDSIEIVLNNIPKDTVFMDQYGFRFGIRGLLATRSLTQVYWNNEMTEYARIVSKCAKLSEDVIPDEAVEFKYAGSEDAMPKDGSHHIMVLSKANNLKMYNYMIELFSKKIFTQGGNIRLLREKMQKEENKTRFITSTLLKQAQYLKGLMTAQQCTLEQPKIVGELLGQKTFGSYQYSKFANIRPGDGIKILTQSVTGYYCFTLLEI